MQTQYAYSRPLQENIQAGVDIPADELSDFIDRVDDATINAMNYCQDAFTGISEDFMDKAIHALEEVMVTCRGEKRADLTRIRDELLSIAAYIMQTSKHTDEKIAKAIETLEVDQCTQ